MTSYLGTIIADFETSLATKLEVSGTTASLQSATDSDGTALPAGRYFFTIDRGLSNAEHISCDLSGTSLTNIKTITRQGVESAGAAREHRVGAKVAITNFAHIKRIVNLLDGTDDFDSTVTLKYDGNPTISTDADIATKKYVDDTAVAGAPDASTTVKGNAEEATQAEIDADTATGGTGARLFTNPSTLATSKYGTRLPSADEKAALVGTSGTAVSSSNKLVDAADVSAAGASGKIVRATGTALPALSGANLTNIPLTQYYAGTDSVADGVGNVTNTKTIGFQPKIIHYIIEAADSNENQWSWGTWTATPTYQTIGAENSFAGVYRSTSAAMVSTFTDGSMTITIGNITSTGFDITYQRASATWSSSATVSFTAIG